jgi:UDP-N-acetylglucosamine 2-epimerase
MRTSSNDRVVVVTIVGARPQFIKAAMTSRALAEAGVHEVLVHTGQHYDHAMSRIFFDELGIPEPDINLGVGSGSHAFQTGEMMIGLEEYVDSLPRRPDWIMVYGDTNSTLAGALVAAKTGVSLAHVEAGLRSFDRKMPEEVNRIVADRLSDLCFCPTRTSVENLAREGIQQGVYLTGDVMWESTTHFVQNAPPLPAVLSTLSVPEGPYAVATIHRAANTDDPRRLSSIFEGLSRLEIPVVLPLHPRTARWIERLRVAPNVRVVEPVGYLQMLRLVAGARVVLTDSGGLQKEALWLGTPCVTLRAETEWVETLDGGWNQLVDVDPDRIEDAVHRTPSGEAPMFGRVSSGNPSTNITDLLLDRHA